MLTQTLRFFLITIYLFCVFSCIRSENGQQVGSSVEDFKPLFNTPFEIEINEPDAEFLDESSLLNNEENLMGLNWNTAGGNRQNRKIIKRSTDPLDVVQAKLDEPEGKTTQVVQKRGIPKIPEIPGIPDLPSVPDLPSPDVPDLSNIGLPEVPKMQSNLPGADVKLPTLPDLKPKIPQFPGMKFRRRRQLSSGIFGGFQNISDGLGSFSRNGFQFPQLPNVQTSPQLPSFSFLNNLGFTGRRRKRDLFSLIRPDLKSRLSYEPQISNNLNLPEVKTFDFNNGVLNRSEKELISESSVNVDLDSSNRSFEEKIKSYIKKIGSRIKDLLQSSGNVDVIVDKNQDSERENEFKEEKNFSKKYFDNSVEIWKKITRNPLLRKDTFSEDNFKKGDTGLIIFIDERNENSRYTVLDPFKRTFQTSRRLMSTGGRVGTTQTPILAKQDKEVVEEVDVTVRKVEVETDDERTTIRVTSTTTERIPEETTLETEENDYGTESEDCPTDLIGNIVNKLTCVVNTITSKTIGIEISPGCC